MNLLGYIGAAKLTGGSFTCVLIAVILFVIATLVAIFDRPDNRASWTFPFVSAGLAFLALAFLVK